MRGYLLALALVVGVGVTPALAQHVGPDSYASPFDWQGTWGSLHINSLADGLNDPGVPSTTNGVIASNVTPAVLGAGASGNISGGQTYHGIKFDLKNSISNCTSVPLPLWPIQNGTPAFSSARCGQVGLSAASYRNGKFVYMPLSDSRSTDGRWGTNPAAAWPGCQQQIANNCVTGDLRGDIYSCVPSGGTTQTCDDYGNCSSSVSAGTKPSNQGANPTNDGASSPDHQVYHVFSPSEKTQLGLSDGAQMPLQYYRYQAVPTAAQVKAKSAGTWMLSSTEPDSSAYVSGTLQTVSTYSRDLARIQAYNLSDAADGDNFIIVDPSPFFDLTQYSYPNSPTTYKSCPVLGLGMAGICVSGSGCNLPVYGVGPSTTFTGSDGSFTYNNYPVMWSGYVLSWQFISPDQYWNSVKNRTDVNGLHIYSSKYNANPVLKVTRNASYCTNEELSGGGCTQYLQYQTDGSSPLNGEYMDLYSPNDDANPANNIAAYIVKHDYNLNANGSLGAAVAGTGPGGTLSFFDTTKTYTPDGGKTTKSAVDAAVKSAGTVVGGGTAITLANGTTASVQLNQYPIQGLKDSNGNPISGNCASFSNLSGQSLFIPTNTTAEFQSFVTAVIGGSVPGVTGGACVGRYELTASTVPPTVTTNGTKTWFGTTSCSQIAVPKCNQVTSIAASRYCQRPTGLLGDCSECSGVTDPDVKNEPVLGSNGAAKSPKPMPPRTWAGVCYFQAECHSRASCPGLATGGHVFCLAPDTKIMMADGSEKAILDVKVGDEVKAFDAKHSRGMLKTAKVKATAVTEKQQLIQINDLKITPLHKVVLANGRAVMARDVKVGDKILQAGGAFEEVTKIDTKLAPVTVYNLSLDNADGYIAGGMRVLEYPMPSGLVK